MQEFIEFIESSVFTRHLRDYLADDDYMRLQAELALNPEIGDLMPGTGGFRKMRWADARRGKGRRGGLRLNLLLLRPADLVDGLYSKDEAADLTAAEKKVLKAAIENELTLRAAARHKRSRRTK